MSLRSLLGLNKGFKGQYKPDSPLHILGQHELAIVEHKILSRKANEFYWRCRRCEENAESKQYFRENSCHNCNCEFCEI